MTETKHPVANSPVASNEEPSDAAPTSAEVKRQLPGSDTVPTRPMDFDQWITDLPKPGSTDR